MKFIIVEISLLPILSIALQIRFEFSLLFDTFREIQRRNMTWRSTSLRQDVQTDGGVNNW